MYRENRSYRQPLFVSMASFFVGCMVGIALTIVSICLGVTFTPEPAHVRHYNYHTQHDRMIDWFQSGCPPKNGYSTHRWRGRTIIATRGAFELGEHYPVVIVDPFVNPRMSGNAKGEDLRFHRGELSILSSYSSIDPSSRKPAWVGQQVRSLNPYEDPPYRPTPTPRPTPPTP